MEKQLKKNKISDKLKKKKKAIFWEGSASKRFCWEIERERKREQGCCIAAVVLVLAS